MKMSVKIKIPSHEDEYRQAYVEPSDSINRKRFQTVFNKKFLRSEASRGRGNIFLEIMSSLFKLFAFFNPNLSEIYILKKDHDEMQKAYKLYQKVNQWYSSGDFKEREFAKEFLESLDEKE